MFKSKYSTLLTILLVVLIVAIIVIVIVLGMKTYKAYKNDDNAKKFEQGIMANNDDDDDDDNEEKGDKNKERPSMGNMIGPDENEQENNEEKPKSNLPKVSFYSGYPTVGTINIPKTKVSYPILLDQSPKALEVGVSVTYPSSPEINQPGNVVIIGHNYRNGKLFSNNKKLENGDIIKITGLDGKTLNYTIYEIFEAAPTETKYMTRNTDGKTEISLSTCTDDGNNRLVILARVEG